MKEVFVHYNKFTTERKKGLGSRDWLSLEEAVN
jgi:hypothetical protein